MKLTFVSLLSFIFCLLSRSVYAAKKLGEKPKVGKNVSFSNDDDDTDEAGSKKPKVNGQGKS